MVSATDTELSKTMTLGLGVLIGLVIIIFLLLFYIMRNKFWEPIFGS